MRLQSIFDLEGCQRSEEQNFVDVMVSRADLDALDEDQVSRELSCDWSSMPTIHHGEVQCLSGRHRIEAAKQHLVPNDRWWIARLFVDSE